MAKWGEGDPRWIVEERPDAKNVNNWHWAEKNATPWSKERLQELFTNFEIRRDEWVCTIDGVDTISGEATVHNRKGKLIFIYEWNLVLNWSGAIPDDKNIHKGKISIPNLSEEQDLVDIEVVISPDKRNDDSEKLAQFLYRAGVDKIREQLGVYITELKVEYSKNLILPKKGEETSTLPPPAAGEKQKINLSNINDRSSAAAANASSLGYKLDVTSLDMVTSFHCSANELYNALTKLEMILAFTKSPAKVDATKGGEFSLYDGYVHGKFEELIPEKKIKQSWRLKSWPSGHFSNVVIDIQERDSETRISLKQTGIPTAELESMKSNWNRYYWNSIKCTFGFGAPIDIF